MAALQAEHYLAGLEASEGGAKMPLENGTANGGINHA